MDVSIFSVFKFLHIASGDTAAPELAAVVDEPRAKMASAWLMVVILVIISLMVFKPGS